MQRLCQAPSPALAQLWCDMLREQGFEVQVQRLYLSGVVGEIPPDQSLPELWLLDDSQWAQAQAALQAIEQVPQRRWQCPTCHERIEGGFEQCWQCGADMP